MALSGGRYNCFGSTNNTCNVKQGNTTFFSHLQVVGVHFDKNSNSVSFSRDGKDLGLKGTLISGDYYPIIYTNSPNDKVTVEFE
jgi:hypothetical protein